MTGWTKRKALFLGIFIGFLFFSIFKLSDVPLTTLSYLQKEEELETNQTKNQDEVLLREETLYPGPFHLQYSIIFTLHKSVPCTGEVNATLAEEISKKVRVLCWVMTQPENHRKKARHVKATWGKRCN
ncbi:unnamed protein product, partial [Darwinula stevensoni]